MKKIIFVLIVIFSIIISVEAKDYKELEKPIDNSAYFNNLSFTYDNPDPSVLKSGSNYYAYSTGWDGINVYKSSDFKTWTKLNKANSNDRSTYSCYWAPEVYYYNNKYYMFYTGHANANTSPAGEAFDDIIVSYSDNPEGPFTNDTVINSKVTNPIDANVLFDGDKIYLYSKADKNTDGTVNGKGTTIYVEELNSDLMSVKSTNPTAVLTLNNANNNKDKEDYWERSLIEAPFVMKLNNKYYLMYSTGNYSNDSYTLSYSISDSPTGPFTRVTIGDPLYGDTTASLLHGVFASDNNYDSANNIYGSGHHFIFKNTDNEMYIAYHSAMFNDNKFINRSLNFDSFGVDSNGYLYVNGPTNVNQPLPSGVGGLYRLDEEEYDVIVNGNKISTLKDYINYNALNSSIALNKVSQTTVTTTKTDSLNLALKETKDVQDLWLFGTSTGFNDVKCEVVINDKYILKDNSLGTTGNAKIQLPSIEEGVNNITINFPQEVELSEVNIYVTNNTYTKLKEQAIDDTTADVVEVPSTSAFGSIIIAVLGIVCVLGSVLVTKKTTNK